MTDRELMKQALGALEWNLPVIEDWGGEGALNLQHKAITALRDRLEQPQPELWRDVTYDQLMEEVRHRGYEIRDAKITAPQPKQQCAHGIDQKECGWCNPAQPEQEPVAWADMEVRGEDKGLSWTPGHFHKTPLYTTPPQRQPLTLREIEKCIYDANDDPIVACRNVEAAHGIKENT